MDKLIRSDQTVHGSLGLAHENCVDQETVSFCVSCFLVFVDSFVDPETKELMSAYFRKADGTLVFEYEHEAPVYNLVSRRLNDC